MNNEAVRALRLSPFLLTLNCVCDIICVRCAIERNVLGMTIKELSSELGVSEQALRQWCKKNNVRKESTKARKASYIIDCDTEILIKNHYKPEKSNETNESKETKAGKQGKESNESKESSQQDLQQELIQSLRQQVEDLKADKQYLQERLAAAEQERDTLTKERQTILAELLELRQPKVIDIKEPAPDPVQQEHTPEPIRQQRRRSMQKRQSKRPGFIQSLTRIFKK